MMCVASCCCAQRSPTTSQTTRKERGKKKWGVIARTAWSLLSRSRPLSSPSFSSMENLLIPFQVFNILSLSLNIFRFFRVYFHSCFPMVYNFFAYSPFFFWKKKKWKDLLYTTKIRNFSWWLLESSTVLFFFCLFLNDLQNTTNPKATTC